MESTRFTPFVLAFKGRNTAWKPKKEEASCSRRSNRTCGLAVLPLLREPPGEWQGKTPGGYHCLTSRANHVWTRPAV
jgi:hypothetical protein